MEYQALYRKWRPARFSDVCGQDPITETLRNQISLGKIGHAYLFTGTRGTGKTSCAKIFAKAVNCLDPQGGEPCGKCANCRLFEEDALYDVLEMDAASKSRVEDVRALIEEVVYAPSIGKKKVYIIDEVQMMSPAAFNALLKTLEEPPEYVVFILATNEVQKIPAPILSRCQRFDFKRLSVETVVPRLRMICQQEGIEIDDAALDWIALLGDGAMRDSLSILEQCQTAGKITRQTVLDVVGMAGSEDLLDLLNICSQGDTAGAMSRLDRFYQSSKRMDTLLGELIGCCRDLLLIQMGATGSVRRSKDEIGAFCELAGQLSTEYLFACADELNDSLATATKNTDNLAMAQMSVLRLCRLSSLPNPAVPAARPQPVPVKKEPQPSPEVPSAPKKEEPQPEKTPEPSAALTEPAKEEPHSESDLYPRIRSAIAQPNIRFFIPQKGILKGEKLTLFAASDTEYEFACRSDVQEVIRSAAASVAGFAPALSVVRPAASAPAESPANDSFCL